MYKINLLWVTGVSKCAEDSPRDMWDTYFMLCIGKVYPLHIKKNEFLYLVSCKVFALLNLMQDSVSSQFCYCCCNFWHIFHLLFYYLFFHHFSGLIFHFFYFPFFLSLFLCVWILAQEYTKYKVNKEKNRYLSTDIRL